MQGVARSFNALAAESAAFADDKRIKRAIFSAITADKGGLVRFSLRAELDPKILVLEKNAKLPAVAPTPANIATTTQLIPPATTSPLTKAVAVPVATTSP